MTAYVAALLAASLGALAPTADARFFVAMIPNGVSVPCVNDEPGCHKLPLCESYGHYDCFPGKPLNGFGMLYKPDPTGLWDLIKCSADSDGDGWINGDELGDPCCTYQYGYPPKYNTDITSPNHASSFPSRPSCSKNASLYLPDPTTIGLAASGGTLAVSYGSSDYDPAHPTYRHSCICSYRVRAVVTHNSTSTGAPSSVEFSIATPGRFTSVCGLQPGARVAVYISVGNRAGVSSELGPFTVTMPVAAAPAASFTVSNATVDSAAPVPGVTGDRAAAVLAGAQTLCPAASAGYATDYVTDSNVVGVFDNSSVVANKLSAMMALPANGDASFASVYLLAPAVVHTDLPERAVIMPHTGAGRVVSGGVNASVGSGSYQNVTFDCGGMDTVGRIRLVLTNPTMGIYISVGIWFSSIVLGAVLIWAASDPAAKLRALAFHAPLNPILLAKGYCCQCSRSGADDAQPADASASTTALASTGGGARSDKAAARVVVAASPVAASGTVAAAPPAAKPRRRGGLLSRACGWTSWFLPELTTASWGHVIVFATICGGIACTLAYAWQWFKHEAYSFGHDMPLERTIGYGATLAMAIQLLPVTRNSVWLYLLGIPFERALRMHRWVALLTFVFTVWHGVAFVLNFKRNPFGLSYLLGWYPLDAINPLAGTIAGLCIVTITLCSIAPIRRRWYEITLLAHRLWPVAVAMTFLHTWGSRATPVPVLVPPVLLIGLDYIVLAADCILRPIHLVQAGVISDKPQDVDWHRTAYLVCEKKARWAWLQALWPFTYEPGQYVNIVIPQVSMWAHPFSISSIADPLHPGRFTVHIKSMGYGTWSDAVITQVLSRTPEEWRIPHAMTAHAKVVEAFEAAGSSSEPGDEAPVASVVTATGARAGARAAVSATSSLASQHAMYAGRGAAPLARQPSMPSIKEASDRATSPATRTGVPALGLHKAASPGEEATTTTTKPTLMAVGFAGSSGTDKMTSISPHTGASPLVPGSTKAMTTTSHAITDMVPYAVPLQGVEVQWPGMRRSRRSSVSRGEGGEGGATSTTGEPAPIPRMRITMWACGAFGRPSVQLENYKHFILVAGGIGITPIAPMHYALLHGLPVGPVSSGLARMLGCYGACEHGSVVGQVKAVPESVTTVWTTRDRSLLEAFAPLLGATQTSDSVAEAVTAASPPAGKRQPRTSLVSPKANPVYLGSQLANGQKYKTSFCISSKQTVKQGFGSNCAVELRLFLTSGRKVSLLERLQAAQATAATATTPGPGGAPPTSTSTVSGAQQPVAAPVEPAVINVGASSRPGVPIVRTRSMVHAGAQPMTSNGSFADSIWRTIAATPRTGRQHPNAGADDIDLLTSSELAHFNDAVDLPKVNKERPNLKRVFTDIGQRLTASKPARSADAATAATTAVGFWAGLWAALVAVFSCCGSRRAVTATAATPAAAGAQQQTTPGPQEAVPASRRAVSVDASGRIPVAVIACGPMEMVHETIRSCQQWNAGPGGAHVVFHVHHEVFNF